MAKAYDFSEFFISKDTRCAIGRQYDNLSEEDRALLTAALAEPTVSNFGIARWLKARGFTTTDSTVSTHRKGRCRCDKAA